MTAKMTTQKCKNSEIVFFFFIFPALCAFFTQDAPFKSGIPACFFVAKAIAMGYNDRILES